MAYKPKQLRGQALHSARKLLKKITKEMKSGKKDFICYRDRAILPGSYGSTQ